MDTLKFEIVDLNCHERFELETMPGCNDIVGGPGAGKSTILAALELAEQMKDAPKGAAFQLRLQVRDGASAKGRKRQAVGQLRMPGVEGPAGYDLTPAGGVVALESLPRIHFLPGRAFAELTRHGRAAPETADKAELKAFGDLTGIETTPEALAPPELAELVSLIDPGRLTTVQESVRKVYNDAGKRAEDDAAAIQRKIDALRLNEDPEALKAEGTIEDEKSSLEAAEKAASRVRMTRYGREEREAQRAQFAAIQQATRPDVTPILQRMEEAQQAGKERLEAARQALATAIDAVGEGAGEEPQVEAAELVALRADRAVAATQKAITGYSETIADLQRQIDEQTTMRTAAEARLDEQQKAVLTARESLNEATQAHERWETAKAQADQRKAAVARAQKAVEIVEVETRQTERSLEAQADAVEQAAKEWDERQKLIDVPPASAEVLDAEQKTLDAVAVHRVRVQNAERKAKETARKAAEDALSIELEHKTTEAGAYRHAAGEGLQERIAQVLSEAGIVGWSILDGVLCCTDETTGKARPLRDLSASLRDTAVAELMIARAKIPDGRVGVLVQSQEATEGKVIRQRIALDAIAKAHGIHVIGARHDDAEEPLRVERIQG